MTGEEIWKLRKQGWMKQQNRPGHDESKMDQIVDRLRRSGVLKTQGGVEPPVPIIINKWH